MYTPNKWLIVKLNGKDPHYRVFATWSGGYLDGDSWKLNSGITGITEEGDYYLFAGSSGSIYKCHKRGYGSTGYGHSVIRGIIEQTPELAIEILPDDTDILNLEVNNG
jgi:hypothetical protein